MRLSVGDFNQRFNPRATLASTNTAQALPGQNAVIHIQWHNIGHGA